MKNGTFISIAVYGGIAFTFACDNSSGHNMRSRSRSHLAIPSPGSDGPRTPESRRPQCDRLACAGADDLAASGTGARVLPEPPDLDLSKLEDIVLRVHHDARPIPTNPTPISFDCLGTIGQN